MDNSMPLDDTANSNVTKVNSPLAILYKRESETPDKHYMTQPIGEGNKTFTRRHFEHTHKLRTNADASVQNILK